jgi:hypothetical protein
MMVQAKRCIFGTLLCNLTIDLITMDRALSQDGSVDLHGITTAEAITIVREILQQNGASPRTSRSPPMHEYHF